MSTGDKEQGEKGSLAQEGEIKENKRLDYHQKTT